MKQTGLQSYAIARLIILLETTGTTTFIPIYTTTLPRNYRHISGQARYEADFEADNWSYLFLASSYGKVVRSDDDRGLRPDEEVRRLLRRNRCNNVFIRRAAFRRELDQPTTTVDQFEEQEWRYRRSLANYLSGWLICHRRAAVSLAIYLTGSIVLHKQIYKRDDAKVVVQINRIRIPTLIDAVVQEDDVEEQRLRFREICRVVDTDYRRYLRQPEASEFAQTRLRRLYQLAKIPLVKVQKLKVAVPVGITKQPK